MAKSDEIKSVLLAVTEKAPELLTLEDAKQFAIAHINESRIVVPCKKKMVFEIQQVQTMDRFWSYIYNAILKYNGLGVIQHKDF